MNCLRQQGGGGHHCDDDELEREAQQVTGTVCEGKLMRNEQEQNADMNKENEEQEDGQRRILWSSNPVIGTFPSTHRECGRSCRDLKSGQSIERIKDSHCEKH